MKGFTESRGICLQQGFDSTTRQFIERLVRHPFLEASGSTAKPIPGPQSLVVDIKFVETPAAKPVRKAVSKPATSRKVA